MTQQAMASYMALCENEIVNAARVKAYVDGGIVPAGFDIRCAGCEGLEDILPCDFSEDMSGYSLPELDGAPWYDPAVPESKNFAGLMVMSATMSAPYSRTVTPNIGVGSTLGRLKLRGRDIVVRGFLIGKTCCAAQYGLSWLTDALTEPCTNGNCGGCDLDFLSCCPNLTGEDECLTTIDSSGPVDRRLTYIRPAGESEFQRGSDFFRRMHGVGIIDGPNVLSTKGSSCGCATGSLIEVEFILHASSPYINSIEETILGPVLAMEVAGCETAECDIVWDIGTGPCLADDGACVEPDDCLDDPRCPIPLLPPEPSASVTDACGSCVPEQQSKVCVPYIPVREWGSSTLNFEIFAGSKELRNLKIQIFQNPLGRDCGEVAEDECMACSTLVVKYVPAGGTLRFSGEERTVTVTCNGQAKNAMRNIAADEDGTPFDWPNITCTQICACITFDCILTADDATVRIGVVNRDL